MIFKTSSKTFLLIPSMPTPNGRLHLGHIAGPFLRLDAATRYLRSRGHKALLVSGTDAYESYVSYHAQSEDIHPHKLAQKYTLEIQNDLAAFNIDYDIWLDPLSYPGRETYERHCHQLLQRLTTLNAAKDKTSVFPYSSLKKQFIPRSFLAGKCPNCQSGIVGNICEGCGRQFMANEVVEPYLRAPTTGLVADQLQWREADVLTLSLCEDDTKLQNIEADVQSLNIPAYQTDIVLNHIRDYKCSAELTVPGAWGVPWQNTSENPQIMFSYSAVYPFFLAVGEIVGEILKTGKNAFAVDTNIVTISSYGSDITIPWIAVPNILSHVDVDADGQRQYAGYDHYWGNEFLCLHGSKFSTSRRHVIWASELIKQTPVSADMARFYLATIDPAEQQTDFIIDDLINTINHNIIDEIYRTVDTCLADACLQADVINSASPNMSKAIAQILAKQDSCFESSQCHLEKAVRIISEWIKTWHQLNDKTPSDNYWFVKGLAIISYPIMPNYAERLWLHLGAEGIPNIQHFDDKTTSLTRGFQTEVEYINQADIYPCLPHTLSHLMNDTTEETNHV